MADAPAPDVEMIDRDGYVETRYRGTYTLESYLRRMDISVAACVERGATLLLVDITALEG